MLGKMSEMDTSWHIMTNFQDLLNVCIFTAFGHLKVKVTKTCISNWAYLM